jgi:hypothetical protein
MCSTCSERPTIGCSILGRPLDLIDDDEIDGTSSRVEAKPELFLNGREERRQAVRTKRIGNANIFEAMISRDVAQSRLIDDLLNLFGGRTKPVMAHLIQSGRLTLDDIKDAEQAVRALVRKDKKP